MIKTLPCILSLLIHIASNLSPILSCMCIHIYIYICIYIYTYTKNFAYGAYCERSYLYHVLQIPLPVEMAPVRYRIPLLSPKIGLHGTTTQPDHLSGTAFRWTGGPLGSAGCIRTRIADENPRPRALSMGFRGTRKGELHRCRIFLEKLGSSRWRLATRLT